MRPQLARRWGRLIGAEPTSSCERLTALGLTGLSKLYGVALRAHHAGYRFGLARRTRLPAAVVSIGNLTLGGTGKTTAAIAVARWLGEQGRRVAVLSRGYRGTGERGSLVVSEGFGPLRGVDESGDEPYLIARRLAGVYVLVGKDRRRTGRRAVDDFGAEVLVLDDGFQYQRLVKDIDIVLVDAMLPFGYDSLVPRGLLREPVQSLARADAVWITHADLVRERDLEAVRERVEGLARTARVWQAVHRPVGLRGLSGGGEVEPEALRGRRVQALSSLGNPGAFERTLGKLGAVVVSRVRFPDHHQYVAGDIERLVSGGRESPECVVTTEKDAVRLLQADVRQPVWVLEVELAGHEDGPTLSEEFGCLLGAVAKT